MATQVVQPNAGAPKCGVTRLKIGLIRCDAGTQTRVAINQTVVQEYADEMRDGETFPPVNVVLDGEIYLLADGFHRVAAAKSIGAVEITAEITRGTIRDAIYFAVGANGRHGLNRTNEDKRNAVTLLLSDREWKKGSDKDIAKKCAVSDHLVGTVRKELFPNDSTEERTVERGGKKYPMKIKKIGKKQSKNNGADDARANEAEAVIDNAVAAADKPDAANASAEPVGSKAATDNAGVGSDDVKADDIPTRTKPTEEATLLDLAGETNTTTDNDGVDGDDVKADEEKPAKVMETAVVGRPVPAKTASIKPNPSKWIPVTPDAEFKDNDPAMLVTFNGAEPEQEKFTDLIRKAYGLGCLVFVSKGLESLASAEIGALRDE